MSCQGALILLLALFSVACSAGATAPPVRLVFAGDVLLSREVKREIQRRKGQSPWALMGDFLKGADWVMGNLEGSVGQPSQCTQKNSALCFSVEPNVLRLAKLAGFTTFGVENNHSSDLSTKGRITTRRALSRAGLFSVDYEHAPGFFQVGDYTISFISLNQVPGKEGKAVEIPSHSLRQKIRLAKSLSDWLVVNVHWGIELADWVSPKQRKAAEWLVEQGVDVVLGHHPHVIQAAECVRGKPVFFSLGNHVFDQKYPSTKQGLLVDCRIAQGKLACSGVTTETPANSSFPRVKGQRYPDMPKCQVPANPPVIVEGYAIRPRLEQREYVDGDLVLEGKKAGEKPWTVVAKRLLALYKGRLSPSKKEYLFTLEAHVSSIDRENSPRPYVYEVTPRGLIAEWRGSALAWPLIDGKLMPSPSRQSDYLCALHRKDSFILLDPNTKETRTAVYQWNGFGFSGVEDPRLASQCQKVF